MATNILQRVSHFQQVNDRESDTAFFRTHVPWVAPQAYLNIIFKPAPQGVLKQVASQLGIPKPFVEFLAVQNGAILFSGALSTYGVHRPGQLLDRDDFLSRLPFNIAAHNQSPTLPDPEKWLAIGGYGYDGSNACIHRLDSRIGAFREGEDRPYHSWATVEEWLDQEISRLSTLFDMQGRLLTDKARTLPGEKVH